MSTLHEAAAILGPLVRTDVVLAPFTTYRLGGPAALFVEAGCDDDLLLCRKAVLETGVPTLVVGKGSNLLISDRGFPGLVVMLGSGFATMTIDGDTVTAGAATPLPVLARKTAAAGLYGLEWAVGVPGTVGGALRMNAGGHGSQTCERLVEYTMIDLSGDMTGSFPAERLEHSYRHSNVTPTQIVTDATFYLDAGESGIAEVRVSEIVRWRREHQPGGRNAGSVFTNPRGDSAGRLIDAAGLRGYRVGTAHVSDKHANFIQSQEGGSASDVLALMGELRSRVEDRCGVQLQPELRLVGFTDGELEVLR